MYGNLLEVTTVWTANADVPVTDPATASLAISPDGNLVLLDQSKNRHIWSTNISTTSNSSTIAVILDTGSLVLTDAADSSTVYWRSMDHPTNTWLPGGRLGLNKITGERQRLVAWRSSMDTSPGLFSLELDPNGTSQYFIEWNNSVSYWTSGPWIGNRFSLVPEMTTDFTSIFQFVDNASESYFIYSMKDDSILSRLIIDVNGQIKQLTWLEKMQKWILFWSQPRTQCEVHAFCGAYGSCNPNALPFCSCIKGYSQKVERDWDLGDYSAGCKRNIPLQCQTNSSTAKMEADKFYTIAGVRLPDNAQKAIMAGSSQDCQVTCLNNCSCNAYTYNTSGCFVWHGNLVNLQKEYSENGGTLFLRLAAAELPGSKRSKAAIVGAVVGSAAAVLIILAVLFMISKRLRRARALQISDTARNTLIAFRYSDLQHVTNNFSDKLGGGAFGSVYKGCLPDSTSIAVKRLERLHHGEKQFRAEVNTVGVINHSNLVRLLGFCADKRKRVLVYDYIQGGSLDFHLFRNTNTVLNWNRRYKIALGISRGLAYLHEQCRECIIHCDLKPENVLIDAEFNAKVADFGMAKLLGRDFSRVLTTMRGTIGYLAPEWLSGMPITPKIDVYSFGMTLLELISGKRNTANSEHDGEPFFPCWAAMQVIDGNELNILDPRLRGAEEMEELTRVSRLACWCIQDFEAHRPSMGLVVMILEGVLDVNLPPLPRSLRNLMEYQNSIVIVTDFTHEEHDPRKTS